MKPLIEQTTSELVKLHNSLVSPTKAVVRFANKETAMRRVQALLDAQTTSPQPAGKAKAAKPAKRAAAEEKPFSAPAPIAGEPAASKVASAPRKSTVHVEGPGGPFEYRSVAVAFKALGLPMGKHQLFRRKLKASGQETIDPYAFHTAKV